jgi:hypothetical protein
MNFTRKHNNNKRKNSVAGIVTLLTALVKMKREKEKFGMKNFHHGTT